MARPLKIQKTSIQAGYPTGQYGIVGGDTTLAGNQIKCRVKIGTNAEADGWIIRQKGARKYLVADGPIDPVTNLPAPGTNIGICELVDFVDGNLTALDIPADGVYYNTMTVTATLLDASTIRLAKFGDSYGYSFTGVGYHLTFGAAAGIPTGSIYAVASVAKA
jgi:hypothetical protein